MMEFDNLSTLKASKGQSATSPEWFNVTQELVNEFAHCTKDFQWIHTDPEKAKLSPFGGPVAHGFYSLSLLPMFIEQTVSVKSAKMGVNYGFDKIRFLAPVKAGARIRGHFTLQELRESRPGEVTNVWEVKVEIENES